VFGQDGKIWEDWIFLFIQRGHFPVSVVQQLHVMDLTQTPQTAAADNHPLRANQITSTCASYLRHDHGTFLDARQGGTPRTSEEIMLISRKLRLRLALGSTKSHKRVAYRDLRHTSSHYRCTGRIGFGPGISYIDGMSSRTVR
jgi:hypothetical protein